jgi:hypothetical protein
MKPSAVRSFFRPAGPIAVLVLAGLPLEARAVASPDASQPSISITLESSRTQLTAGSGLGISAEVKNTGNRTVYLRERDANLTLPVDMEENGTTYGYYAYFPSEAHNYVAEPGDTTSDRDWIYYKSKIAIQPGESYKMYWSWSGRITGQGTKTNWHLIKGRISSEMRYIFFTPGQYKVSVVAKYWLTPTLTGPYHFVSFPSS